MKTIPVSIVTPDGPVYEKEVEMVSVKARVGKWVLLQVTFQLLHHLQSDAVRVKKGNAH